DQLYSFGQPATAVTVNRSEELQDLDHELVCPWPQPIRQVEDRLAPASLWQRRTVPEHIARMDWKNACYRFEERRLARSIRADKSEYFSRAYSKGDFREHALPTIVLAQA